MKSQTAVSIAATSSNGTSFPAPVASMSFAKRYGVETAAQPAAMAKVNAPDAICSGLRYGVRKTSVACRRSANSGTERKRSSNSM
jgi:hypothetical protein